MTTKNQARQAQIKTLLLKYPKLLGHIQKRIEKATEEGLGSCLIEKAIKELPKAEFAILKESLVNQGFKALTNYPQVKEPKARWITYNFSRRKLFVSWDGSVDKYSATCILNEWDNEF